MTKAQTHGIEGTESADELAKEGWETSDPSPNLKQLRLSSRCIFMCK